MTDTPAMLLRDGIVLLTWATAVYLVFSLLTLLQLGFRTAPQSDAMAAEFEDLDQGAGMPTESASIDTGGGFDYEIPPATPVLQVSPRYEVALSLAFQGFDIAAIARRCDISVGEAKLVAALAESYQGLQQSSGEPYGGDARAAA